MQGKVRLKARVVYEWEYWVDPGIDKPQEIAELTKKVITSIPHLHTKDHIPEVSVKVTTPYIVGICLKCQGLVEVDPGSAYYDTNKPDGESYFLYRDRTPVFGFTDDRVKDKPFCECKKEGDE